MKIAGNNNRSPKGAGRLQVVLTLLAIMAVLLSGCGGGKDPTVTPSDSDTPSSGNVSDNSSPTPDDASDPSSDVASVDAVASGQFTFDETVSNTSGTVKEILPTGNTASLSNPLKGYADAQAEALRSAIVGTGNTENYYTITGKKYYVSSDKGDDANDGTSPSAPLKTIEAVRGLPLSEGDAVLFERGSVFRLYTTFLTVKGVTYGSYGTGEKPKFYGSPANLANAVWTPSVKRNVWQMDYIYADCGSMIFDHGQAVGYRKTGLRSLEKNTDFFQDKSTNTLYLYCDKGNPAKVYADIEIALRMGIIGVPSGVGNVVIDNLCLKYGGIMGVSCTWNAYNVSVTNCEIGYIGGATTTDGNSRYGNGIQFWTGAKNIVCNHNWIYQVFDTAISWQGYGGADFSYENITFNDNLLEYNNADFEYWDKGSTVRNFTMANNIMRFTSLGWGTRIDDGGPRGIDGSFVGNTKTMTVDGLRVQNNIIDCPGRMIINWQINAADIGSRLSVSGTKIYVNAQYRQDAEIYRGYKLNDSDPNSYSVTTAADFVAVMQRFDAQATLEWHEN